MKPARCKFFPESSGAVGMTYGMHSIMRSARITSYKSKKIANRPMLAASAAARQ
ncbi:hypothetical protein OH687_20545 [Burkholderia anthina]|nr:hypothetical protein OH687_20545 [Burkholderia anthina]